MIDLRRHARVHLDIDATFSAKGSNEYRGGRAKDISIGGMFVETSTPLAFNQELTVTLTLPGQNAPFTLPGVVRWTRPDGMGIQFGLLGARETYAITEVTRAK